MGKKKIWEDSVYLIPNFILTQNFEFLVLYFMTVLNFISIDEQRIN